MTVSVSEVGLTGKNVQLPTLRLNNLDIIFRGNFIRRAEIKDELFNEAPKNPDQIITDLKKSVLKADIFTFTQKLPDINRNYDYYYEWDNIAAIEVENYEKWHKDIHRKARQSLNKAERKGVVTRIVDFNYTLIEGIKKIFDETPVRQGKRFWHYSKDLVTVKKEMSRDLDRSVFIGAFFDEELIGFIKIIKLEPIANLAQILSMVEHRDKSPTTALIAAGVRFCAENNFKYLTYGNYTYGKKGHDTLTYFKEHNGFSEIKLPRYFIPLTFRGRLILSLKLHNGIRAMIPKRGILAL